MEWLDLRTISPVANAAIFVVAAMVAWLSGHRLARYSRAIADRTTLGQAFIGTLLLGVTVSLPEMTLAGVAAALGNAGLAVNSLLGGIAMVMVMVAVTDFAVGEEPLSQDVRHPVVLLQGPLVILMLTATAAGITAGDPLLPGIGMAGMWTTVLIGLYLVTLILVKRVQQSHPWTPDAGPVQTEYEDDNEGSHPSEKEAQDCESESLALVIWLAALAAAVVFAAGTALAVSADALAEQTGLGAGFVGFILGGVATSLPELSTTISSVRLRQYEMAFSDAFGTNLCSLAVLFLADLLYDGGPILNEVGRFSTFAALLGIGVTAVYLVGLIARPRQAVWRMGLDSLAVLVVSASGFLILYRLK